MVNCPLCKQPMKNIPDQDYNGFMDAYFCTDCQLEQAIYWDTGERIIVENKGKGLDSKEQEN